MVIKLAARNPNPVLSPGKTIDRYIVEAVIGQGGMAMVYRVRHNRLGSRHALKVLTVTRPNVRKRLLREGRVQAELHHPNLVGVTDVLDIQGAPALLMEYVDGPSLEWVLRNHKVTLDEGLALFRAICSGVAEAHQRDLVHRDLKPGNVLLARRGEGWLPKVTDFGIAKILQGSETPSHTGSQVAMGTPAYMAPEQIRDARSVDQRADIFSLGVLLYELTLGVPPFAGTDVLSILNAVATGEYIPPLERDADLPPHIAGVIDQCLRLNPAERIQDCYALLDRVGGNTGLNGRTVLLSAELGYVDPAEVHQAEEEASADEEPSFSKSWESSPDDDFLSDPTPPILLSRARTWTDPEVARARASQVATVPATPQREAEWSAANRLGNRRLYWGGAAALVLLIGVGLATYLSAAPFHSGTLPGRVNPVLDGVLPPPSRVDPAPPVVLPAEEGGEPAEPTSTEPPTATPRRPQEAPSKGSDGFLFSSAPAEADPSPWGPVGDAKGRIVLSGEYRSARLVSSAGSLPPGELPVGTYRVEVDFDGQGAETLQDVEVRAGQTVRLLCDAERHTCRKR
ncbi:MAG: protein kinase [Deltaproteobacteria bacterium]|nr:protein kinase [Deltaproteobacteria bacterium]